jgi:CobQ-like glutamine amidotransferase family enzyme
LLAHGRWFSPGTPASSTTKTGRHDIAEILLKMALNTKYENKIKINSINQMVIRSSKSNNDRQRNGQKE